jgi:hypothetical protein
LVIGGIATIALVVAANTIVEQMRLRRMRVLAATNLFMHEAWNTIAAIPLPFLPLGVRAVLAKLLHARLSRAMRYYPDNDRLIEHARRIEELVAQTDAKAEATVFDSTRRREIRRELMDVKRICAQAAVGGHITEDERSMAAAVIDAMGLRLLIDHLVDAAGSAEALGSFEEARTLFQRAIEELSKVEGHDALVERIMLERRCEEVDIKLAAKQAELAKQFDEAMRREGYTTDAAPRSARYE